MANWLITDAGGGNPNWSVRLSNCSEEHAESVLAQLKADMSVPERLEMVRLERLYDDPPSTRRPWWRVWGRK